MATVVRKRKGAQDYYYLRENMRQGKTVVTREIYLGTFVPLDIEDRKRALQLDVFRRQWLPRLDRIRAGFRHASKQATHTEATKERDDFAIRFTYDTQRIEGSTLSLRETADLLEHGLTPQGKPIQDVKQAEAHRALFLEVLAHPKDLTARVVLEWHKRLFRETKPDIAGRWRRHGVRISGSRFMPPSPVELDPLLADFFAWYQRSRDQTHPVERAALAHLKFVTIHPFADGNGRLSRLLMNFVLHRSRWPLFNIPYANRGSYYRSLERSQTKRAELPFLRWFVRQYATQHRAHSTRPTRRKDGD